MATYTTSIDSTKLLDSADLQLNEQHMYGSSRLGILTANRSVDANTTGVNNYVSPWTGQHLAYYTGRKQYELSTVKYIRHKDDDNVNNHISNLHLTSGTEIHKASYAKNRRKSHFASLTPKQKRKCSLQNKRIATFDSLVAAEKAMGAGKSSISSVLNGRYRTAGGFIWKRGKM